MNQPSELIITKNEGGSYNLRVGDRWENSLTCDEALYVVASWICSGRPGVPYLKDAAGHHASEVFYDNLRRQRLTEDAKQLVVAGNKQ